MTNNCFNCNEELENHDSQKMTVCLTSLSIKMESIQKNLEIYPTGHVGMIASSYSQKNVLPTLTKWIKARSN